MPDPGLFLPTAVMFFKNHIQMSTSKVSATMTTMHLPDVTDNRNEVTNGTH